MYLGSFTRSELDEVARWHNWTLESLLSVGMHTRGLYWPAKRARTAKTVGFARKKNKQNTQNLILPKNVKFQNFKKKIAKKQFIEHFF
jgi:hypothetical protein